MGLFLRLILKYLHSQSLAGQTVRKGAEMLLAAAGDFVVVVARDSVLKGSGHSPMPRR